MAKKSKTKLLNSPHRETQVELLLTPEGVLCISVAEPGYKLRSITPNVGDSWEVVFAGGRPWFRQASNEPELYPLVKSIKLKG